ncbi:hypothetical protein [Cellulomonas soli]
MLIGLLVDWLLRRWMPMTPAIEHGAATQGGSMGGPTPAEPAAEQGR